MLLCLSWATTEAQSSDEVWTDEQLFPSCFLDISEGWATPQGKRVYFPWRADALQEQAFHKTLRVPDSLLATLKGDTLYIWVEGIAWESELVLNNQYWAVKKCMGDSWAVGIPRDIWQAGPVEIIITVRLSSPDPLSPPPSLWIKQPICLLTAPQLKAYQQDGSDFAYAVDSIAIVPPYYRGHGWNFDGLEALRTLQPVLDQRIKYIYFPFPADRRMRRLCDFYGLRQVSALPEKGTVMWAASYPMAAGMSPLPEAYWLDDLALRTPNYGVWLSLDRFVQIPGEPEGRESVVFVVLGIMAYLLFLRTFFPGMFAVQVLWFWPGRWTGEAVGDLAASLPGPLWLWLLSRWVLWGSVITLATLMLKDQGVWLSLRPSATPGIAWHFLSQGASLPNLLGRSILLLVGLDLVRYGVAWAASLAFGIPKFGRAVLRLDLLATFPMVYMLGIPWAAAILYPEYGVIGVWLGGGLLTIHVLRLTLATAAGLQQFYTFSGGLIFLYICTLKALPYFILW
ncbi:MAG: hypothetical protein NWR72_05785 [Bacteroidia bacterium]|nr:hypothetical protein [Bacteroidia bacterium]